MSPPGQPADPGRFVERLAGFVELVRARGVSVGVGAQLDLARALHHLPILDRGAFLEAARVTLGKSPADLLRIEEAFDLFWSSHAFPDSAPPGSEAVPRPDPLPTPPSAAPAGEARPSPDPTGILRIGVYSPDAPAAGHPLRAVDRKRLAAFLAGGRRFRRFAASLPGRRWRAHPRGRIDFAATARRSLRHGGEWIEMRRRVRKPARADLVVLWDVSGSMRDHDSGLFALVYALRRTSLRCRVFAFSTTVEEITDVLRARSYPRAVSAVARSLAPASGGTRIGRCLADFRARHGSVLHPWTTLVVLSDGWDLGEIELLARELESLRRRVHLLAWVNPYADLPEFEPATAGMREALPFLDFLAGPAAFESSRSFRLAT